MIEIRTPARLHLGLLDTTGNLGRLYGSIGVAIDQPGVRIICKVADTFFVEGLEVERVTKFVRRFLDRYPIPSGVHFQILSTIPAHVGLGSGTQLALAVGTALAQIGRLEISIEEIALAMGRGTHSGIGINAFHRGGFVLDGGHRIDPRGSGVDASLLSENRVPPVIFHHPFPDNWYFAIIVPKTGAGLSGQREKDAFRALPSAPPSHVEKVCHLLLMKMLPALIEKDVTGFGQALTEIQRIVGDCFASIQGGRFANPMSEQLINFLLDLGAAGAGQSSWGPTVYGLVEGEDALRKLIVTTTDFLSSIGSGQIFSARPDNQGATISIE